MNNKDITVLTFNLSWACNTQCSYCYRSLGHDQSNNEILKKEDLIAQATIAHEYGVKEYRISGGEPLCVGEILFDYADIIYSITGSKPILMTSGHLINDTWMNMAENKFSAIAISIDNPFENNRSTKLLELIKANTCNSVPLTFGLTLVKRNFFKDIYKLFTFMYDYVDHKFMPQLDYPCLGNSFELPNHEQLNELESNTFKLFSQYGIVPYYFVYLVGSLLWLRDGQNRIVVNLHPEGNYQIYESFEERVNIEYRWRNYLLDQQMKSKICQTCDWIDTCRHHPLWEFRYDWCPLRKSIFQGMYRALINE
jgi:hypothetical protein